MTKKIDPVIEVFFDPFGSVAGRSGCYRARLRDARELCDAGTTPGNALRDLIRTIRSFSDHKKYAHLPQNLDEYRQERLER